MPPAAGLVCARHDSWYGVRDRGREEGGQEEGGQEEGGQEEGIMAPSQDLLRGAAPSFIHCLLLGIVFAENGENQTASILATTWERSRAIATVRPAKVSRRRVGRRAFLAVADLGACGAGCSPPHALPRSVCGLLQAAYTAASGELDQLEGVSLDAALKAAQITAAAVHVIVVPVARLVATLGSGGLSILLAALDAAHNALTFVHVSTTPIDLLRGVIASWQAGLTSLPIALDTYASADITSAEAYLTALKRKVAQQQKGASA